MVSYFILFVQLVKITIKQSKYMCRDSTVSPSFNDLKGKLSDLASVNGDFSITRQLTRAN